jgi:hypothetical protein
MQNAKKKNGQHTENIEDIFWCVIHYTGSLMEVYGFEYKNFVKHT